MADEALMIWCEPVMLSCEGHFLKMPLILDVIQNTLASGLSKLRCAHHKILFGRHATCKWLNADRVKHVAVCKSHLCFGTVQCLAHPMLWMH